MENIRQTADVYHQHGIPFIIDACRFAENAWFIKQRDPAYKDVTIKAIVKEIFSYADGCTMSAKKDAIVNIGGFIGLRDKEIYDRVAQHVILHEGFVTYGGLAGRDLEAIAVGLQEGVDENYLAYRESHTRYLGDVLEAAGLIVYRPTGGHAVYVDAGQSLPGIPPSQFPGVALANMLYLEGGIRAVEIGSLMFEHEDPVTGERIAPASELVRFAIPRRVYTRNHLDFVGEAAKKVVDQSESIKGLKIVAAPKLLRHFLAELAWID